LGAPFIHGHSSLGAALIHISPAHQLLWLSLTLSPAHGGTAGRVCVQAGRHPGGHGEGGGGDAPRRAGGDDQARDNAP